MLLPYKKDDAQHPYQKVFTFVQNAIMGVNPAKKLMFTLKVVMGRYHMKKDIRG